MNSIKVFKEPESANEYYNQNQSINMLLCGEINSIKPTNFYLGNSPVEYINEYNEDKNNFLNKNIIFTSTNGAKIISHNIDNIIDKYNSINQFILSFLNIEENINYLLQKITNKNEINQNVVNENAFEKTDFEIILVCGGENGNISIEDTICAIMFKYFILNKLNNNQFKFQPKPGKTIDKEKNNNEINNIEIQGFEFIKNNLIGKEVLELNNYKIISEIIKKKYKEYIYQNSKHIKRLKELKFDEDIEFCLQINKYNSILVLEKNLIFSLKH